MSREKGKSILVIAIGNPLRSDDGVGEVVIQRIDSLDIPGVETRSLQQLNVGLVDEIVRYHVTLLVDASNGEPPVNLRRVQPTGSPLTASSHYLSPESLLALTERLHRRSPELYLCTILGEEFGFGSTLSPAMGQRIEFAIDQISAFLKTP